MGLSGISNSTFFSSVYDWETNNPGPVFIVAIDIDIARNLIEENVKITKLPESFALNFDTCVGGICLAASICATISVQSPHTTSFPRGTWWMRVRLGCRVALA